MEGQGPKGSRRESRRDMHYYLRNCGLDTDIGLIGVSWGIQAGGNAANEKRPSRHRLFRLPFPSEGRLIQTEARGENYREQRRLR